ncbi:MAG: TRAP transporter small permease subunit [Rhodospirillaceae bacterium]|nr:TRAP transporter small permease subunit [Rhodospirillaceae bacterium]MCA8933121.1 TRAP transporter small permease subunit [Rhodospirillaceae bacterium]
MTLEALVAKACRFVTAFNRWVAMAASALVVAMVAMICYEVVVRYAFDAPTVWAIELARLLLGPYFLLVGPYILHLGGHVNVDIFYARLPRRWAGALDVMVIPIIIYFAVMLLIYSGPLAVASYEAGETSTSAWNPIVWPAKFALPVAVALLLAQALVEWARAIARALGREDPCPPPEPEERQA